jgi:hypothetical protein
MDSTPRLLHLHALARHLGVPVGWLRTEAEAGHIPAVRTGAHQWLFDAERVEAVLLERAATPPAALSPQPTAAPKGRGASA